ncbi:MAG: hypothetical protein KDB14_23740 [Planctomycetales bacterium]|nr:hypothetical protein [Planctomycetales bacterium]
MFWASLAIIFVGAAFRFLPHAWNFTPIGAIALFAGATLAPWYLAVLTPLAAMAISDSLLGFNEWTPVVYACMLLYVGLGRLIRHTTRPEQILGASVLGSVLFFLITNFVCWYAYYPPTIDGLRSCYVAAVPFFRNTLLSDLFFSATLFGAMHLIQRQIPAYATVRR